MYVWQIERVRVSADEESMLLNYGAGEDSWESLGHQVIKPVNPKEHEPLLLIGKTDAETEATILWPPDSDSQFISKDPKAGKDWRKRRRGQQKMRWLDRITDSKDVNSGKLW